MAKKLAIAVIHGIGNQGDVRPKSSDTLSFSKPLQKRVRRALGKKLFDREIAWREIFWADILLPRQLRYLNAIRRKTNYDKIREFVLCNIADGAAYKKFARSENNAYDLIHARVHETIADLDHDTEEGAPLLLLGHSFGSHILSNYIWDHQNGENEVPTAFQRMETVKAFVSFGTNIPMFLFAYPPEDIKPIHYPGTALSCKQPQPWWLNFYDRDDVLAYPLREVSPGYEKMVDRGEIKEVQINAGNVLFSWNPASHNAYWKARQFINPLTEFIREQMD